MYGRQWTSMDALESAFLSNAIVFQRRMRPSHRVTRRRHSPIGTLECRAYKFAQLTTGGLPFE